MSSPEHTNENADTLHNSFELKVDPEAAEWMSREKFEIKNDRVFHMGKPAVMDVGAGPQEIGFDGTKSVSLTVSGNYLMISETTVDGTVNTYKGSSVAALIKDIEGQANNYMLQHSELIPNGFEDSVKAYAKHAILFKEMKFSVQRNGWEFVEQKYQELMAMQERGEITLTREELSFGAEAARAQGNMMECKARLNLIVLQGGDRSYQEWLDDIKKNYGEVSLSIRKGPSVNFNSKNSHDAPDQRKSLEFAYAQLQATGTFKGLLPVGEYTLGSQNFLVTSGGNVQLNVKK